MDVDEAQSKLGRYGRYQVLYYVIICLATNIPACWHMLATFFHGKNKNKRRLLSQFAQNRWNIGVGAGFNL